MASDFNSDAQTLNLITQSIINVGSAGQGSSLAPKQVGEFQTPFVKNLRMGPISSYLGGTQYTLLWDEPDNTTNVSHYNVFVKGLLGDNQTPLGPYSVPTGPARLRLVGSQQSVLTFYVQTQLNNGNVSVIDRSPSCTSQIGPPIIQAGSIAGSIGVNQLLPGGANQIVGTDPSGVINEYKTLVGTNNQIVVSPTSGAITLSLASPLILPSVKYTTVYSTGSYTCTGSETFVGVDTSGGASSVITSLSATEGQVLILKKTDSGGNALILSCAGAQTTDPGSATSTAYGSLTFIYSQSTSRWNLIAKL